METKSPTKKASNALVWLLLGGCGVILIIGVLCSLVGVLLVISDAS